MARKLLLKDESSAAWRMRIEQGHGVITDSETREHGRRATCCTRTYIVTKPKVITFVHDGFLKNIDGLLVKPKVRDGAGNFDAGLGSPVLGRTGNVVVA